MSSVDFVTGGLAFRSEKHLGGENLIKACASKTHRSQKILDATCGMGKDAFLLHKAGHQVTATEQNPIVFSLLKDGLDRYQKATGLEAFKLHLSAAESLMMATEYDIIYLDPMFPAKRKSALAKKDMQIFQAIHHNENENTDTLFLAAQQAPCNKIVLKRPKTAAFILNIKPTYQLTGKFCRFDVYQK
ncbi:MAG: class I SAM-dependent methyltransferase [Proteobacteria bacterium]|nr:class I SAM-dependent methyltransferase [Pseudomonadota bacterium]